ncbi:MAG: hypothetical protein ABI083_06175, partial [Lapillicoccus sp.]
MFRIRPGRLIALTSVVALLSVSACSSSSSPDATAGTSAGPPSGDILVLTNRTDIVDTVFKDYATKFEAKYPQVKV